MAGAPEASLRVAVISAEDLPLATRDWALEASVIDATGPVVAFGLPFIVLNVTLIVLVAVEVEALTVAGPAVLLFTNVETLPVPPDVFAVIGVTVPKFVANETSTPSGAILLFWSTTIIVMMDVETPSAVTFMGKAAIS